MQNFKPLSPYVLCNRENKALRNMDLSILQNEVCKKVSENKVASLIGQFQYFFINLASRLRGIKQNKLFIHTSTSM